VLCTEGQAEEAHPSDSGGVLAPGSASVRSRIPGLQIPEPRIQIPDSGVASTFCAAIKAATKLPSQMYLYLYLYKLNKVFKALTTNATYINQKSMNYFSHQTGKDMLPFMGLIANGNMLHK